MSGEERPRRFVLLEDDHLQAGSIVADLLRAFPTSYTEVVSTEYDFRASIAAFETAPPDAFIIDIMLPWARPKADMPTRPDGVRTEGFRRAGVRCRDLLSEREILRGIPVILYSVLERADLDLTGTVVGEHVRKEADSVGLVQALRRLLHVNR